MKVIGITGAIASGKTTTSKYIKSLNYKVYDCDEIAHNVFEKESIKLSISKAFNLDYLSVTRKKVSSIVFNDKEKLNTLNSIMKDAIINEMKNIISNESGLIFFDVPLLFEFKLEYMFDSVIFVYASESTMKERLVKRDNIDYNFAKNKINAQINVEEKLELARKKNYFIINNNEGINELNIKIDKILKEINNGI